MIWERGKNVLYTVISKEQFLEIPETKPASEYINGEIFPKSMPQGEHSLEANAISLAKAIGSHWALKIVSIGSAM